MRSKPEGIKEGNSEGIKEGIPEGNGEGSNLPRTSMRTICLLVVWASSGCAPFLSHSVLSRFVASSTLSYASLT